MAEIKEINAWADVGSHGGIYEFTGGPVADRYPHLLHIYSEKMSANMVPVRIVPIKSKSK